MFRSLSLGPSKHGAWFPAPSFPNTVKPKIRESCHLCAGSGGHISRQLLHFKGLLTYTSSDGKSAQTSLSCNNRNRHWEDIQHAPCRTMKNAPCRRNAITCLLTKRLTIFPRRSSADLSIWSSGPSPIPLRLLAGTLVPFLMVLSLTATSLSAFVAATGRSAEAAFRQRRFQPRNKERLFLSRQRRYIWEQGMRDGPCEQTCGRR